MGRGATTTAGWVALAVATAGCHPHFTSTPSKAPPPELPVVPRPAITPDVSGLPTGSPGPAARPGEYRRLTAAECRALAAGNAPFADDLDRHPENTPPRHPRLHPLRPDPEEAHLGRVVRGYAADELRNRAAGDALDEYFRLARAEGQYDLLLAAAAEVRGQVREAEAAAAAGLADRADLPALRARLLDLDAQAADLDAAIGSLNAALRARLNLDPRDPLPLAPDDPLRVRPDDVDPAEAVRTGLHYRPDLNLLRALLSDEGQAAEDLARGVLAVAHPLLALARTNPLLDLLLPLSDRPRQAAEAVRGQIRSMLDGRERQAEAEIRAAVLTLRGKRAAATARAAEVRLAEGKVREAEARSGAGLSVAVELAKAKLDLLKARGDLLQAAADWNAAEAKLRQAMGLLVRE
jgi:hypothetical protein